MTICRDCTLVPGGLKFSGVTNQLCLPSSTRDSASATGVAVTLAVSVFIGNSERKRSMSFVLTLSDPKRREEFLTSFHVDKAGGQSIDTRVMPVALDISNPGLHWIKLYSRQRELHRVPLEISFKV